MTLIYSKDAAIDCSQENFIDVIVSNCRKFKNQTAFVDSETGFVLTFNALLEKAVRVSQVLERKFHLKLGDVVGVLLDNSSDYCTIVLGCLFKGIAVHLLKPSGTPYELDPLISRSKPSVIFASESSLQNALGVKERLDFVKTVVKTGCHGSNSNEDFVYLEELIRTEVADVHFKPAEVDQDTQVAMILNSSGTSGLPKSALLTHRNFTNFLSNVWHPNCLNKSSNDTTIVFVPFYHIAGVMISMVTMLTGMVSVVMPKFNGQKYLELIDRYGATFLMIVPPIADFLVQSPLVANFKLDSISEVFCGAAPLAKEIQSVLSKRLNVKVRQLYGMTEVTGVAIMTPKIGKETVGAVGKLVPGFIAKINPVETEVSDTGYPLGEICFKSPSVMKGYLGNDEATMATIDEDGFLHTGDLGYCDDEGTFFVIDRLKELIKYKGFQVPPAELEDLLKSNPEIHDAGVVGKPDRRSGELPVAFIVRKPGSQITEVDVKSFISERLSPEKHLHEVHFVDALPKNPTGKTLRRVLKQNLTKA